VSSVVKESSDTSDELSDAALESESGDVSLPNGIPVSTKDVSELFDIFVATEVSRMYVLRRVTLMVRCI